MLLKRVPSNLILTLTLTLTLTLALALTLTLALALIRTVLTRKSIEFMLDGFHFSSDWHVPGSYGLSTGLRG